MTPEEWRCIKTIFDAAAELPPAERDSYLGAACAGNSRLLLEVRSLLQSLDDAGDFIEPAAPAGPGSDPAFHTGMSFGPYRIVQVIGEGGMGMVYQAVRVDDLYRKLVALKVVRRGLCTPLTLRRFETERHILAHLEHPNIARLLDGGTTPEGQPWFVMDFIAGTPIDQHCDEQRLPLRERLQLFLTVCSAVRYAHQNFVVHRDIKPQNILVTAEGAIRLLDFGVAKLLDPESDAGSETTSVVQMMTPEYASPEQLHNQAVTTASDTYSLGVLLYVLLTGQKPFVFKTRSVQEICDVIRDTEPGRPSVVVSGAPDPDAVAAARGVKPAKLAQELSGDLDTILLMSLRREPERRYSSVEQLAGDIERYLDGRPVTAREDSFAYRSAKFMRRHQGAVIAASFSVFLLIAGTMVTSWEAHVALRERERAERRFNDVRRVANSLLFDVHDAIWSLPGSAPARRLIAVKALDFLDRLAQDAGDDRSLQRELAAAYERVGDVQRQSGEAAQPGPGGAVASYRKALTLREALAASADLEARRELAPTYAKLSDLLWGAPDSSASLNYSRKLLALSEAIAAAPGATAQDQLRLASSNLDYGYKQSMVTAESAAGLDKCRKAVGLFDRLAARSPADTRLLRLRAVARDRTAEILARTTPDRPEEAVQLRRAALEIKMRLAALDPADAEFRRLVAWGHYDLAVLLQAAGDLNSAKTVYELAVRAFGPDGVESREDLALARLGLASALLQLHRSGEAKALYRQAVPVLVAARAEGRLPALHSRALETAGQQFAESEKRRRPGA